MTMHPEQFRNTIHDAIGRNVRLVPTALPGGCLAAWYGDANSDNIVHADSRRLAVVAAAHAAAHVALLHCGEIRDSGRFVCVDPRTPELHTRHQVRALLGCDGDELPLPLFTTEEEQEADKTAEVLLKECCFEGPLPRFPGIHQTFRCLG